MKALRFIVITAGLILIWQVIVWLTAVPPYILPGPMAAAAAWVSNAESLVFHASVTALEIVLGLIAGTVLGASSAIAIILFRPARQWLLPVLVTSQAIPVFAIAPILVLWLGFGIPSKVAMATLIIYFPVAASFLDGLRRTEPGWLDLALTMTGKPRRFRTLIHIRIPAALPSLASGIRVAAAVAPIGAVVGEWVGAGAGLGYLMLHASGRVQIDLMFAALASLTFVALIFYFAVDWGLRRALPWQPDQFISNNSED
jgi:putative hydroxymethylpyrimidine transport system permease protein